MEDIKNINFTKINSNGYKVYSKIVEHRAVWENVHGPIQKDYHIHHINGNKLDNRIENLQCISNSDHNKIHSGCILINGIWFKKCKVCNILKNTNCDFPKIRKVYKNTNNVHFGIGRICKDCNRALKREYFKKYRIIQKSRIK